LAGALVIAAIASVAGPLATGDPAAAQPDVDEPSPDVPPPDEPCPETGCLGGDPSFPPPPVFDITGPPADAADPGAGPDDPGPGGLVSGPAAVAGSDAVWFLPEVPPVEQDYGSAEARNYWLSLCGDDVREVPQFNGRDTTAVAQI
jgi:hypothetical protein